MHLLYSLLLYLLVPFVVLRLLWLGKKNPHYLRRWPERFGFTRSPDADRKQIWIHAVSVGEIQAARPLVEYLQRHYPEYSILLTSVTPTGAVTAEQLFGGKISHRYIPYDLPSAISRFLDTIRPCAVLILETEIWPNLYRQCRERDIPLALINARLSEKSFRGYKFVPGLIKSTLQSVTLIAAQSSMDAERFISLGVSPDSLLVTGNLKFDIRTPHSVLEQAAAIRRVCSVHRPVWIAASTHEGEEELVLQAMQAIREQAPDCLLILAPRHPHRCPSVRQICEKRGFKTTIYTEMQDYNEKSAVIILDVLGQLVSWYGAADLAFVGGSLVPVGGHNMLEPAALGRPVICGPHVFNFREIADLLDDAGALIRINNPHELSARVLELLADANLRDQAGNRAKAVVEENQGTMARLARVLNRIIPPQATV